MDSSLGPEMISGVRASSIRIESTSSTMAKLNILNWVPLPSTAGTDMGSMVRWTQSAHPELHVVAEVIEPEFVVGAVGDVGGVAVAALAIVQIVHDDADAQPQGLVDPAHPFRVALGQIIVDRDHVHAEPGERVQINRKRRHQRLAFAGLHFGDFAAVQHDAADQLDVEMPHVENAAAGFAHGGERRNQNIVERGALRDLLLEGDGLRGQFLIGELLHARLHVVDGRDQRAHRLDVALVLGAENLRHHCVNGHNRTSRS